MVAVIKTKQPLGFDSRRVTKRPTDGLLVASVTVDDLLVKTMLAQNGEQYENPFARQSEPFNFYEDRAIEPDAEPVKQQREPLLNPFAGVSGSIGTVPSTYEPDTTTHSYTGEDTLDEPVSVTIPSLACTCLLIGLEQIRDLKQIGRKLQQVLNPKSDNGVLKEWDLWGPLILCLTLAITLATSVPASQSVPIFTGVFVIVWLGAAVVTLNANLLGGSVSFFMSVCVLGYCLFPLVLVAVLSIFIKYVWFRVPSSLFAFAWSTYAALGFLSGSTAHLANRRALAVYPLFLFYLIIAWLVAVS
ncbi:Yip1 domain-containing protein [Sporodiniella umbellata]|nr:Yip1 domain-containing protein [Sporodiniella umbellata]